MVSPTAVKTDLKVLPVVETFHSVQGEGFWTGVNAFFIRLAGCDVGCPWCDTKHSWPMAHHPMQAVEDLVTEAIAANPFMVVITGGEPLMHDLQGLTDDLHAAQLRVHLETSGSHPLSGQFDWISLSPKRYKPPLEEIYNHADELKVVIGEPADLVWAEKAATKVSPQAVKLLQPRWVSEGFSQSLTESSIKGQTHNAQESEVEQRLVFDYVLSHPSWRVGLQTHKFLGVR
ncbi:MAG: 7-carboxy-7-deazaguanine synthase QueE [Cyanobacteria bacterium P01_F01_bin.53]